MYKDLKPYNKKPAIEAKDLDHYLENSRGLERNYMNELVKSRKLSWVITACFAFMALLAFIILMISVTRALPAPVVLFVDKSTGDVSVGATFDMNKVSDREIFDNANLARYVISRESYDYHTLDLLRHETALMSSPEVQSDYAKIFEGKNAIHRRLKASIRIFTKIVSITSFPENGIATVRFTTEEMYANGSTAPLKHFIANIGYKYVKAPLKMADLLVNGAGFQVISYRVDPEIIDPSANLKNLGDEIDSEETEENEDDEDNN